MLLCSRVHTRRPGAPSRTGSQAWAGKGPGRLLHLLAMRSVAFVFSLSLGRNVRHLTRSTDAAPACHLQADRAVCVLKRAGTAARCPPPPEAASAREPGTWGCAAGWAIGRARTSNKNRTAQARGRGAGPAGGRLAPCVRGSQSPPAPGAGAVSLGKHLKVLSSFMCTAGQRRHALCTLGDGRKRN